VDGNNLPRSKQYMQAIGFMYYLLLIPINIINTKNEKNHGKFKEY
jgi:hypothetical protein